MKLLLITSMLGFSLLIGISQSFADFDVDEADSLDFGGFHSEDDERRQLWEEQVKEKDSPENDVKIQARAPLHDTDGQGASQALNLLYQKMQKTCPQGWDQHREWAALDNGVLYLYREFQCRTAS